MHFRITSSFQRYILIFKWKALHYNSYNNFFSFTFSLYFPFQFLLHYLSVPMPANQERDKTECEGGRERERERLNKMRSWETGGKVCTVQRKVPNLPVMLPQNLTCTEVSGFLLSSQSYNLDASIVLSVFIEDSYIFGTNILRGAV